MARVFLGDQSRIDAEVLAALEALPDDFWILGEFTLRRNFDWFILRPFDDSPAALIVTEVKRRSRTPARQPERRLGGADRIRRLGGHPAAEWRGPQLLLAGGQRGELAERMAAQQRAGLQRRRRHGLGRHTRLARPADPVSAWHDAPAAPSSGQWLRRLVLRPRPLDRPPEDLASRASDPA